MSNLHCDVAIIGGGPVGASLALALRDSGLKVYVLEARKPQAGEPDPRALALSYGSRMLLERLGIWGSIQPVSSIRSIHVSQKRALGRTILSASKLNVPELGYVLPYHALHSALQAALQASDITYLTDATVTLLEMGQDHADIAFRHRGEEKLLSAGLAAVADGGKLLEAAYPPEITDYGQSAVIAHVTCAHPLVDTAFERFTVQGPVALLPYQDGYELVWTAPHAKSQQMLEWDEPTFLAQLHEHFGDRVGAFRGVGIRSCFPLRLRRAPQTTFPHTVLLGNAAQTLHPVAGQGFNMGLRDAWQLAQEILNCAPESLGSEAMLADYAKSRRFDRNAGIRFTDSLVRLFSNDLLLLGSGRAAALSVLDCLPFAKQFVAKRMMFGANG